METTIVLTLRDECPETADRLEQWVRSILTFRQRRAAQFGSDLFYDLGWDLLLNLAIAPPEGLTRAELAAMTKWSEESTRRWLEILISRDLVAEGIDLRYHLTANGVDGLNAILP